IQCGNTYSNPINTLTNKRCPQKIGICQLRGVMAINAAMLRRKNSIEGPKVPPLAVQVIPKPKKAPTEKHTMASTGLLRKREKIQDDKKRTKSMATAMTIAFNSR